MCGWRDVCMRAEKCLKTVFKLSIMVKQHIFNINSQSLLVEIIIYQTRESPSSPRAYLCA